MVVYVDVLVIVNAVVNYFLLLMTAFFAKEPKKRGRLALAAFAGSLFSLTLLLPPLHAAASALVRLSGAAAMAALAFGIKPPRRWGRNAAYLFIASGLLAGALYALAEASSGVLVRNQSFYIDLSPVALIAVTLAVYLLLSLVELLFRRPRDIPKKCAATLTTAHGAATVCLLPDTGDRLRDGLRRRSVVVLKKSLAPRLLGPDARAALYAFECGERSAESLAGAGDFSLIPYATVGGAGLLLGFPARTLTVRAGKRERVLERPVVAFTADELLCGADGIAAADELFCME